MEIKFQYIEMIRHCIQNCQSQKHIQQVAYSTYHDALTQVCFTCKVIRTSMKQKDLEKT